MAVGVGVGDAGGTAVAIGVGDGATTGNAVEGEVRVGEGLATRSDVGAGAMTRVEAGTNLTTTDWLESILILAVLPATAKTGPTHSSISQPGWSNTSMVTVRPCTNNPWPMALGLNRKFAAPSGLAITSST